MVSKTGTSQGIRSTPSWWNPNSSSASRSSAAKARCLRWPLGGGGGEPDGVPSVKDSVLFRNFLALLSPALPPPPLPSPPAPAVGEPGCLGATESLRHFLSICCMRTISVILFDFLAPDCSISSAPSLGRRYETRSLGDGNYGGLWDVFNGFRCDAVVVELCGADGGGI
nr:unnamed protein product [Digitaria exilis]